MSAKENLPRAMVEEAVRSFGRVRFRALGTSMTPSVLPGDLISVERAEPGEISVGEIVLFSRGERLFVHRVVASTKEDRGPCLTTRGDRLNDNDPPVHASELLGRVVSIERGRRAFRPAHRVSAWKRPILSVLRASDLATRAYVRLVALAGIAFTAGPEPQS